MIVALAARVDPFGSAIEAGKCRLMLTGPPAFLPVTITWPVVCPAGMVRLAATVATLGSLEFRVSVRSWLKLVSRLTCNSACCPTRMLFCAGVRLTFKLITVTWTLALPLPRLLGRLARMVAGPPAALALSATVTLVLLAGIVTLFGRPTTLGRLELKLIVVAVA